MIRDDIKNAHNDRVALYYVQKYLEKIIKEAKTDQILEEIKILWNAIYQYKSRRND